MTTRLEELANKFKASGKKPTKDELNEFVKESLLLINQVNDLYKKFFVQKTNPDGSFSNSLLTTIENKIDKLGELYKEYFITTQEETGNTIEADIENFTQQIKDYHKELLDGEQSIQADIKISQDRINDFYYYLFTKVSLGEGEDQTEDGFIAGDIRADKLKQYIANIKEFHDTLEGNEENQGYQEAIESFYNYLYQLPAGKTINKADKVKEDIKTIETFRDTKYDKIVEEIEQAKKDADSLLNAATGGSLVEGYEQSKNEYKLTGKSLEWIKHSEYPNIRKKLLNLDIIIGILLRNLIKVISYYLGRLFNYLLFIIPLAGSVIIFIQPELLEHIGIDKENIGITDIRSRFLVSIPLWWISLFGQRNISQRKRIAEEYNHKIQILKTYLNFTTNESSYPLDKISKQELSKEVLEVIKRRPGDVYGKDESMFDKIIELMRSVNGNSKNINNTNDEIPNQ